MHITPIIALAAAQLLAGAGWVAAQTQTAPSIAPATSRSASVSASAPAVARVVQALGAVQLDGQPLRVGDAVHAGQWLSTGPDGHLYLQTTDQGFIILRPGSRLWLAHYHIDAADPARSRIRLELQRGLVRHISGQAAQAARGQFRFNTPVAAIGIIGTDFTVYSTEHLSRVAVESGAVQVSAFGNGCLPDGWGPCMGPLSLPLQASQAGQVVQVERGRAMPELITAPLQPNASAAPAVLPEPLAAAPGPAQLLMREQAQLAQGPGRVSPPPAPVSVPAPPVLHWGRWQALAQTDAGAHTIEIEALRPVARIYGLSSHFAVLRSPQAAWVQPREASLRLELAGHLAQYGQPGHERTAHISSGEFKLNFVEQSLQTRLRIQAGPEQLELLGRGVVAASGQIDAQPLHFDGTNLFISGALATGAQGAVEAAYIFRAHSPLGVPLSGVTFWQQTAPSSR